MSDGARSDLLDLTVTVHARTERAIKVSDGSGSQNAVWLPLSQIEVDTLRGTIATVTCHEWLAHEKGLI